MINELKTAIYGLITGANAFNTDIGGRFYYEIAPQGAVYPFASYHFVAHTRSKDSGSKFEDVTVQFSLYSNASDDAEIGTMEKDLMNIFDNITLTITGYTNIRTKSGVVNRLPLMDDNLIRFTAINYLIQLN